MPEIKSGLGTMNFSSTEPARFTVSDESEHSEERPKPPEQRQISAEEMNQYRTKMAQDSGRARMGSVKSRIEMLTGITRGIVDVEVGDAVFSLRTLKGKEAKFVLGETLMAQKNGDFAEVFFIRVVTLAFSLYKVDGVDFDSALGVSNETDDYKYNYKIEYLSEMDDTLISLLYSKFEEMTRENNIKFGIKSAADAKEVSKEMKKSS